MEKLEWWIVKCRRGLVFAAFVDCWTRRRSNSEEITGAEWNADVTSRTGPTTLLSDCCYIAVCVWSKAYMTACQFVYTDSRHLASTLPRALGSESRWNSIKTAVTIIVPANIVIVVDQWGKWLKRADATNQSGSWNSSARLQQPCLVSRGICSWSAALKTAILKHPYQWRILRQLCSTD